MKYYISENSDWGNLKKTAYSKAREDAESIVQQIGYSDSGVRHH